MALEEAGVKLVAEGAAAYASDMKQAAGATDTFVDTTEKGGGIVSKAGGMMGSAIKGVATIAAGVGVAGFVALGKAIFDGIGDAREAQQLLAQTNSVIESTGGAAGKTANQITDLATALSASAGKSLFGDSDVQAAENLLLTFTNIKGAVFDAATAISVDMAQALGGAPKDQAIALGKALNDPIKGVTALTRVGVTFSEEQKEQIKTMQEAGDVAGAQTIILNELNKEFGGSAAAAAAADGGWAQFKDTMGELAESVGAAILPLLNELVGFLNTNVVPVVTSVVEAFGAFVETMQAADDPVGVLVDAVDQFSPILGTVVAAIGDFIVGGGDLGQAIDDLSEGFQGISPLLDTVIDGVQGIYAWFQKGGAASVDLSSELEDLNGIWQKVLTVIGNVADGYEAIIKAVLPVIQQFIADHGEEIQAFFKKTWDSIIQIINLALDLYNAIVPPVLNAIAGFISAHGAEIQAVLSGVWKVIESLITGTLETIKGVIKVALAVINGDWEGAWTAAKTVLDAQVAAIKGVVEGVFTAITGLFNTNLAAIGELWESNWNALKDIVTKTDWAQVGKDVINGVIAGINSASGQLIQTMTDLAKEAWDAVKAFFGIESPSKLMMTTVGEPIVQGMMRGIEGAWPELTNLVGSLSADLVDDMEGIGRDIQNAIGEGFGATASIDRQMSKNLDEIGKIQDEFTKKIVTQDLDALQKKATDLFGDDPKVAADYYKMASNQEFELLKIRKQIAEATTDEEKDRLNKQLILVSRAQDAELDQFYAKQKGKVSPAQNIANEINDVMKALSDPALKLTNDQLRIVDLLTGVYSQFANPPSTSLHPAYTGQTSYNSTTNVNMPVYTNNTPGALQQSYAVLQAGMI